MSKLPCFAADIEGPYEKLNNYSAQGCETVAPYPFDNQAYTMPAARGVTPRSLSSTKMRPQTCLSRTAHTRRFVSNGGVVASSKLSLFHPYFHLSTHTFFLPLQVAWSSASTQADFASWKCRRHIQVDHLDAIPKKMVRSFVFVNLKHCYQLKQ